MNQHASEQAMSPEESFHNGFFHFLEALTILAANAEEQCEAVGDYNVAWDLKTEVLAGEHLLGHGFLQPDEEGVLSGLVAAVAGLPVDDMPSGEGREPNLVAMQDGVWGPLRTMAWTTREKLAAAALRTSNYFEGERRAI